MHTKWKCNTIFLPILSTVFTIFTIHFLITWFQDANASPIFDQSFALFDDCFVLTSLLQYLYLRRICQQSSCSTDFYVFLYTLSDGRKWMTCLRFYLSQWCFMDDWAIDAIDALLVSEGGLNELLLLFIRNILCVIPSARHSINLSFHFLQVINLILSSFS